MWSGSVECMDLHNTNSWTHQFRYSPDARAKSRDGHWRCLWTIKTVSDVFRKRYMRFFCLVFFWRQLQSGGVRQELTRQDSMRCGVFIFQLGFLHYTNTSWIIVQHRTNVMPFMCFVFMSTQIWLIDKLKSVVVSSGTHLPSGRKGRG